MFDMEKSRYRPRISRRAQGILAVVAGLLLLTGELAGATPVWWRAAPGAVLLLVGLYAIVTPGRSNGPAG